MPGAFPPVLFDVEVDGEICHGLHADGGVISQDTTLSDWRYNLKLSRKERANAATPGALCLIRNGAVEPEPAIAEHRPPSLAGRAISTLIKMQGIGDILAAHESARLSGAEFNVAWIGRDFETPCPGPFEPEYMGALHRCGCDLMMVGEAWERKLLMLMSDEERRLSPRKGARRGAS